MSNRVKHRRSAPARCAQRLAEGLPTDPSNRTRAPQRGFRCPCGREFRHLFQVMMHLNLHGDHANTEAA